MNHPIIILAHAVELNPKCSQPDNLHWHLKTQHHGWLPICIPKFVPSMIGDPLSGVLIKMTLCGHIQKIAETVERAGRCNHNAPYEVKCVNYLERPFNLESVEL